MNIVELIQDIDKNIKAHERNISELETKKDKFKKIQQLYPSAQYNRGAICLDNIWDKITCMRIEWKRVNYNISKIYVKFLMGKRHTLEGMPIYVNPYESPVAEIHWNTSSGNGRTKREIIIFDFKNIMPTECSKRKSFIKRIKFHLIDYISRANIPIHATSYYKDELEKLVLLK